MRPPKTITVNYQPLKTAEGIPYRYISVESLKEWIENYGHYMSPVIDRYRDKILADLKKFIEREEQK